MLGHLIAYLRAALPQLRASPARRSARRSSSRGRISTSCRCAWAAPRLRDRRAAPSCSRIRSRRMLLISLVENAIKHGIEPSADGGTVDASTRARDRRRLVVDGRRHGPQARRRRRRPGGGVGPHQRARAARGALRPPGRFTLERSALRGARATLALPSRSRRPDRLPWLHAPTALIAEDEPIAARAVEARGSPRAWPELAIVARGRERRGSAGAVVELRARHRVPRHPHAGASRARGRARARRRAATSCSSPRTTNTRSRRSSEGAVDYVLKPPTPERIAEGRRAAEAARWPRRRADLTSLLAQLAARDGGAARSSGSARRSARRCRLIAVDDVLYFQAEDKYTKVVTRDGEALIRKPIKELFDELDPRRSGRSTAARSSTCVRSARVERDWRDQPRDRAQGRGRRSSPSSRTFAHRVQGDVASSHPALASCNVGASPAASWLASPAKSRLSVAIVRLASRPSTPRGKRAADAVARTRARPMSRGRRAR